jgi:hypothetical protein
MSWWAPRFHTLRAQYQEKSCPAIGATPFLRTADALRSKKRVKALKDYLVPVGNWWTVCLHRICFPFWIPQFFLFWGFFTCTILRGSSCKTHYQNICITRGKNSLVPWKWSNSQFLSCLLSQNLEMKYVGTKLCNAQILEALRHLPYA